MNNGAKFVVALVLLFAGAGLYMAIFPPGSAKKPTDAPSVTRPGERTPERATPGTPPPRTPSGAQPNRSAPNTPSGRNATGAPEDRPAPSGSGEVVPTPTRPTQPAGTPTTPAGPASGSGADGARQPAGNAGSASEIVPNPAGASGAAGASGTSGTVVPTPPPAPVPVTPVAPPTPRPAPPAPSGPRDYTILEGDTFTSIAEEYFGDRRKAALIVAANPNIDPMRLAIGQKIRLPAQDAAMPTTVPAPTGGASSGSATAGGTSGSGSSNAAEVSDTPPTATAAGRYTVRKGDTLASIADRFYGTKAERAWRQIYEANRGSIGEDPARLKVGAAIVIPPRSS